MKFSFKGMTIEIDNAVIYTAIAGVAAYAKALVIDYKLGKNKNLNSNSMLELAENKVKGKPL